MFCVFSCDPLFPLAALWAPIFVLRCLRDSMCEYWYRPLYMLFSWLGGTYVMLHDSTLYNTMKPLYRRSKEQIY